MILSSKHASWARRGESIYFIQVMCKHKENKCHIVICLKVSHVAAGRFLAGSCQDEPSPSYNERRLGVKVRPINQMTEGNKMVLSVQLKMPEDKPFTLLNVMIPNQVDILLKALKCLIGWESLKNIIITSSICNMFRMLRREITKHLDLKFVWEP